jgi:hypothetical protein
MFVTVTKYRRRLRRWVAALGLLRTIVVPTVVVQTIVVSFGAATLNAQSPAATEVLRRAFLDQSFRAKTYGPVRWLDGGRSYTTL